MTSSGLDLTISVVSYNTAGHLEKCLASLYANTPPLSFEVIVVDNASRDGSSDMVARMFPQAQLIRNDANKLFTKANNQAWRQAKGEFFLLCNPDVQLPPKTLETLVTFMRRHPETGVIGPRIFNEAGEWQPSCIRSHTWRWAFFDVLLLNAIFSRNRFFRRKFYLDEPMEGPGPYGVETVTAAFLLVRKSLLDELGGMDEHYQMYCEETDLCQEVRNRGLKVTYLPAVQVLHSVGQATRSLPRLQIFRWCWNSNMYFYKKHLSPGIYWILRTIGLVTWPLYVGVWWLRRWKSRSTP